MNNYLLRHLQNFFGSLGSMSRQPASTAMTVAVIGIALALPSALHVLVQNGSAIAGRWQHIRDFSVYLSPGTPLESARRLAEKIEQRAAIDSVSLVPADEALREFRESPGFADVMEALEGNPLPHTLIVHPVESAAPGVLGRLGRELAGLEEVDLVKLDTEWVSRLNAGLDVIRRVIWIAAVLLIGAVVIIVGNTIRLDIQNRRSEIEVSKLLGATDAFVRRPFLYIGFWYGLFGGVFALLLLGLSFLLLQGPVGRLVALYGGGFEPLGMDMDTMLAVLAGGLIAGWGGAWSAVTRHLAVIQPQL